MALQAHKARREILAHQARQVRLDHRVYREYKAHQELLVLPALKARQVQQAHREHQAHPEIRMLLILVYGDGLPQLLPHQRPGVRKLIMSCWRMLHIFISIKARQTLLM